MIDGRHIGHRFAPFESLIEAGRIRLFCKAIGENSSIHFEASAALDAGYSAIVAPLTFPTAIIADAPNPRAVIELIDVDIGRILHGEEHYEYFAPIVVGDRITTDMQIVDIVDKKGGAMEFVISEYRMCNHSGELVCKARRTLVVRAAPAAVGAEGAAR